MGMNDIADRLDGLLAEASDHIEERHAEIIERDSSRMAHHIVAYVLEGADPGVDPFALGATMVQGASIGEDEAGGELAEPVIAFLESVLEGAKSVVQERYGADNIVYDPIAHAVQYYCAHGMWPESATSSVIAKAKAAITAGQGGSTSNKATFGTYY